MSERLVERYSRVERNSSRLEGLYGDLKEVRVMAGNGNDRHDRHIHVDCIQSCCYHHGYMIYGDFSNCDNTMHVGNPLDYLQ
jgi:hypothetical protein